MDHGLLRHHEGHQVMAVFGRNLGVRILGEVTRAAADTLRLADHIFIEELRRAGWYEMSSQAFAVFLPVKSVGVTGDDRVGVMRTR